MFPVGVNTASCIIDFGDLVVDEETRGLAIIILCLIAVHLQSHIKQYQVFSFALVKTSVPSCWHTTLVGPGSALQVVAKNLLTW